MKPLLIFAALLCALISTPAEARHHHRHHHHRHHHVHRVHHHARHAHRHLHHREHAAIGPSTVVAHPVGCPRRQFCGCGAAVRVFGRPMRNLWLAANWFRFPRAAPAPGMVAVRTHHVFVLEQYLGDGMWMTYDANSGHHLTRMHARSIAGYTIVDPRA